MLIHLVSCGIHWYHRLVPSIGTIIVVLPAVVPSVVLPAVVPTVVPIVILPEVVPTVVPIVVLPVLVPCVAVFFGPCVQCPHPMIHLRLNCGVRSSVWVL